MLITNQYTVFDAIMYANVFRACLERVGPLVAFFPDLAGNLSTRALLAPLGYFAIKFRSRETTALALCIFLTASLPLFFASHYGNISTDYLPLRFQTDRLRRYNYARWSQV